MVSSPHVPVTRPLHLPGSQPPGVARAASASFEDLSPRQREILLLHVHGVSRREIARRLRISSNTVRNHVQAIYDRTGCTNRIQTLRWALGQPALAGPILAWVPDGAAGSNGRVGHSPTPAESSVEHSPAEIGIAISFFRDLVLAGDDESVRV